MGELFVVMWSILLWSIKDILDDMYAGTKPRRPAAKHMNMQLVFLCCHHVILNRINEKKLWKKTVSLTFPRHRR